MCAYDTALDDVTREPPGQSFDDRSARRMERWENALPHLTTARLAVIAAVCFVFLATSFYPLHHTDLWGHLTYGRWIAENGTLPATDPLAAVDTVDGTAESMTHVSWLAQLAGYQCWTIAGPGGLQLAHVLLVTIAFAALMMAIRTCGAAIGWAAAGGVIAYLLALPITGVIRPQLFAMVAMALTLLAIAKLRDRRHPLVWLPLVFMLWSNLHGSFPIGLVVIGCYMIGEFVDSVQRGGRSATWRSQTVRRAALLLLLATASVTINPHGIYLLGHVLTFGQQGNLHSISEWQPTVLVSLTGGLFFGSLLATGVLLRTSPRQVTIYEVLLLIVFGAATLLATRMLIWWALVWPVVMIPHAAAACALWMSRHRLGSKVNPAVPKGSAMNTLIAVALLFMTLVVSPVGDACITGQNRAEAIVVSDETPVFLADEIDRLGLTGTIFAPMKWSDYLLWHGDGAITPLISSHVHLISGATWRDYLSLARGDDNWAEIIDSHHIEYLILERRGNRPLIRQLRQRSDESRHRVLYQDQRGLIVQIVSPQNIADVKESEQSAGQVELPVKPVKQTDVSLSSETNHSDNT